MPSPQNSLPLVGQVAVADFLPPRIKDLHDGRRNRHKLAIATLIVTAISVTAFLASNAALNVATESLMAERKATDKIQIAQSGYSDIVSLMHESRVLGLAYYIASEPEVDWPTLLGLILKPLSGGAKITSIDLTGTSSSRAATTSPLTGQSITVSVAVDLTGQTYEAVEYFLLDARQWPGYSNAEVTDLHKTATGYTATLDVHLGLAALVDDAKHRQVLEDRLTQ
jgi:hypothetical protein